MARARILIVEDDRIIARDLQYILEDLGHRVVGNVDNGAEALEVMGIAEEADAEEQAPVSARDLPELILMDIRLKGELDGIETARKILSVRDVPVIYLTSYADTQTTRRARGTRPNAYVLKPFDPTELAITIDLSLRSHRDTQAARRKADRLQAALEVVGDAVVLTDEKNQVIYLNPSAETMTRLPYGLWQNRPLEEVIDLAGHRPSASAAPPEGPLWVRGRDGELIPVQSQLGQEKHREERHLMVLRDISDTWKTEESLRRSEQRYRRLFEEDVAGNFLCTPNGILTDCNASFCRIFGFESVKEARDTNVESLFVDPAVLQDCLERLGRGEHLKMGEYEMRRPDGTAIYTLANVSAIFGHERRMLEITGHIIDITDRKTLEDQLRHSQKMEAIGRLAGGIAHDFNNYLGAILGYTSLLERQIPPEKTDQLRCIQRIQEGANRAGSLVDQLLTYSRKRTVSIEEMDLGNLLEGMEDLLQSLVPGTIELVLSRAPGSLVIRADPSQMEQVILNLVTNARDALDEEGRIEVRVDTYQVSDEPDQPLETLDPLGEGAYVRLQVSDDGTGISPSIRRTIFEPYFTTKDSGRGTGLGLATVYSIMGQSGGSIALESEMGQGSTFHLLFPCVEQTLAAQPNPTVLVVEDQEPILELVSLLLENQGYRVLRALDGGQARHQVANFPEPIDLLLCDVVLPDTRGPHLTRELLRLRPGLKVLFMSGYGDDILSQAQERGEELELLAKPFTPEQLFDRVSAQLAPTH